MMNILVTGGAGFIGCNLCQFLLENNYANIVICLDNLSSGTQENVDFLQSRYPTNFKFIHADITSFNLDLLSDYNIQQIYHLACPASPKSYQENPIQTSKTNFLGTLHLLEFAQQYQARILFTSTSEVYGDPLEHPQKESYWGNVNPVGIRSCYDEGKRLAETLMTDFHRIHGVDIRIARLFNTYGPRMASDDGRVVSNFVCQALSNQDITVYGSGRQTRSCCYVSDTVLGLYSLMNQTDIIGPVNIGNPHEININELAELILKLLPESKSEIVYQPLPSDDPRVRRPDITLASHFWKPVVDLETGLRLTIDYFRTALFQSESN